MLSFELYVAELLDNHIFSTGAMLFKIDTNPKYFNAINE